jgi:hypothetical protein
MAVAIAPYSETHFRSLPSLNVALNDFLQVDGHDLVKNVFQDFFINNGMDRSFGLAMPTGDGQLQRHSHRLEREPWRGDGRTPTINLELFLRRGSGANRIQLFQRAQG